MTSVGGSSHGPKSSSPAFNQPLPPGYHLRPRAWTDDGSDGRYAALQESFEGNPLEAVTRAFEDTTIAHATCSASLEKIESEIAALSNGIAKAPVRSLPLLLEIKDLDKYALYFLGRDLCRLEIQVYLEQNAEEAGAKAVAKAGGIENAVNLEAFFQERLRFLDQVSGRINEGWFPSAPSPVNAKKPTNLTAEIVGKAAVSDPVSVGSEKDDWEIQVRKEALADYRKAVEFRLQKIMDQKEVQNRRLLEGKKPPRIYSLGTL